MIIEWLKKLFAKKEVPEMTNLVFNNAFNLLMDIEGGYVFNANDKGGETKYGISKRAYPNENIKDLTLERAQEIYRCDYWNRCKCDFLPDALSVAVFDFAVNSGVNRAVRLLQKALGVKQDGIMGNETIGAANRLNPSATLEKYLDLRLEFVLNIIKKNPTQKVFEKGWTRRIERVRKYCEELV
jgi:lysozyme family protein